MKYNTQEPPLMMREYGRNVQKLVDFISTIEDRQKRTEYAYTLISLMKQLNPSVKENDNPQRIWDHLYIMSNFTLDVDSPFPKPDESVLEKKPQKVDYNQHEPKFMAYGYNIELLIEKALKIEDEEDRKFAYIQIGKLLKTFYAGWQKDFMEENTVLEHLFKLSGGEIDLRQELAANPRLFDSLPVQPQQQHQHHHQPQQQHQHHNRNKQQQYNKPHNHNNNNNKYKNNNNNNNNNKNTGSGGNNKHNNNNNSGGNYRKG